MKRFLGISLIALSLAGCASDGVRFNGASSQEMTGKVSSVLGLGGYKSKNLGRPVSLEMGSNLSALPKGSVLAGMKGRWRGIFESNDRNHELLENLLYISGSVRTTRLRQEDFSLLAAPRYNCTVGLVYLTTQADGTVIYRKISDSGSLVCGKGFVRVQPLDNGSLRVSEHAFTVDGEELRAGVFSRE